MHKAAEHFLDLGGYANVVRMGLEGNERTVAIEKKRALSCFPQAGQDSRNVSKYGFGAGCACCLRRFFGASRVRQLTTALQPIHFRRL